MTTVVAPTDGISDEDRALIAYLDASGVPSRVTTTTNHKALTTAGNPSRHLAIGTNGKGLAIDTAPAHPVLSPATDADKAALLVIFNAFVLVEHRLHELICAWAPFNIRAGQRVRPYAVEDHLNHVHASVDRGVLVRYPQLPHQEDVMYGPFVIRWPGEPIVAEADGKGRRPYVKVDRTGATFNYNGAPEFKPLSEYGQNRDDIIGAELDDDGRIVLYTAEQYQEEDGFHSGTFALERR